MDSLSKLLSGHIIEPIAILDSIIPLDEYVPLDLSSTNREIETLDITNPEICQGYINKVLKLSRGRIAYGGYLEKRNLYADKANFSGNPAQQRTIHLGVDYWCEAGTTVLVPLAGTVHSFKNNSTIGDYGPTIILVHQLHGHTFYTLYGHLSLESMEGLYAGKQFKAGTILAKLGSPDINVNYAPHLHFQIIRDINGYAGDYPGVATTLDLDYYKKNCPDPNILLKIEF